MKLSVVIPAHNESESIQSTVDSLVSTLVSRNIDYELILINDHSSDSTEQIMNSLSKQNNNIRYFKNPSQNGFGYAVRAGLERFTGDCVAIMMADLSDSPHDLVHFYDCMIENGVDCVFGNRWRKGGRVHDYPFVKKMINRVVNRMISLVFHIRYTDTTNAFKLYRRETIHGLKPFLSPHFNLTVELPLKAIIRGYTYMEVPNTWTNRKHGISKLKMQEMGSRYFFILCYCFIEKYFSSGDFRKK